MTLPTLSSSTSAPSTAASGRPTNGGQTWRNITDGKTDISSVGSVAVAPSDPNVIYVGTGEAQLREDLTYGTGVYRSTDAGETWTSLGLGDTQQIADVVIDPKRPGPCLRRRHGSRLRA